MGKFGAYREKMKELNEAVNMTRHDIKQLNRTGQLDGRQFQNHEQANDYIARKAFAQLRPHDLNA
jgi:cell division protein FtsB